MKKCGGWLIVLAFVFIIAGIVFTATSFDKYSNYYNSDTYFSRNTNAYVGGDAYNYIINGTYFTAFAVYAVGCYLCGIISFISGCAMIAYNNHWKAKE